jgi:hypothetical protein
VIGVYRPHSLLELAVARSILEANGIPHFVHNAGYASLYPGIQMDLLNVPTIMVPPAAMESAKEVLGVYLPDGDRDLRPQRERSIWHILRMLIEGICCVWFVPRIGVHRDVRTEP